MQKVFSSLYLKVTKILLNSRLVRSNSVITVGRLMRSLSGSNIVKIDGRKMLVHGSDGLALSIFKVYEPTQTQIVKEHLKEGNAVIDVGAHVGYYTLLFAQLVGEKGKVFAFEPDPANFDLLKKNVEMNGYQNVVLEQKAVSNCVGRTRLYVGNTNRAINRIYDAHMGDTKKFIEVETVRLDDYFDNFDRPINFVKIDAEGSENAVIEGMSVILQKMKNLKIMTEFDPYLMSKFGSEAVKFIQLLTDSGFKIFDILDKEDEMKPVDCYKLLSRIPVEEGKYTYLLCLKE